MESKKGEIGCYGQKWSDVMTEFPEVGATEEWWLRTFYQVEAVLEQGDDPKEVVQGIRFRPRFKFSGF